MLGAKLRVLRNNRQYTLADVGKETGLSVSFLSDVERGRTKPSLDTLQKLAACYQTSVNELLREGDIDASYPPGFEKFISETPIDADLIDLLLSADHRAKTKAQTPEDWREFYYTLKRILGR